VVAARVAAPVGRSLGPDVGAERLRVGLRGRASLESMDSGESALSGPRDYWNPLAVQDPATDFAGTKR
jgi:hypothetical protein